MARSFRTWSLSALLLCCTAVLVGCGGDKKENPKAKDAPGLNERPAPVAPGGDGKKTTTTTVGPGVQ